MGIRNLMMPYRMIFLFASAIAASVMLSACNDPQPLRIGFIGGLTGRASDIGEASRNAVQMAVEQRNNAGGIDGRPIELLIRDDTNVPKAGAEAARELADLGVEAIIGPNISAVAEKIIPVINDRKIVTVAPTVTAIAFSGLDDYFFRVTWTTRDNARAYANHYFRKGRKKIATAFDLNNRIFSESWLQSFREIFGELGGTVVASAPFDANGPEGYGGVVEHLLESKPDALLFIAGGVDTAQLAQQVRKRNADMPMIAAEWAASESLIELGGKAIEGLEMGQAYDRWDQSEGYVKFRDVYRKSFQQEPGFASVAAYDAATVVFEALSRREPSQPLKDALLALGPLPGLQQELKFDAYGDGQKQAFFIVVRDGQFTSE